MLERRDHFRQCQFGSLSGQLNLAVRPPVRPPFTISLYSVNITHSFICFFAALLYKSSRTLHDQCSQPSEQSRRFTAKRKSIQCICRRNCEVVGSNQSVKGILLKLASNLFFILLIICCTVYRLSLSLTFYTYVHVEENKDVKRNLVLFFVCVIPEILVKFPSSDILAVTNTEDETLVKQQP